MKMETLIYGVLILFLVILIYFNMASSIIVWNEENSTPGQKVAKCAFIWLIPIIGFLISLRFSRQIFENTLHDNLVPNFLGKWIYDETSYSPNMNRDDNELKMVNGMSTYDHRSHDR